MPLTVACVLRSGGIYDASWVARLHDGVARHLQAKYEFVCLSDCEVPCRRIPLEHDWPGWWSKIELFKLPGPILYFDLDTVIVGDIHDLAENAVYGACFSMLRDFYAPDHFGSGVMTWNDRSDELSSLYSQFVAAPDAMMAKRRSRMGDQAYIEETLGRDNIVRLQDAVDEEGEIVSYKVHCRNGIPPNARVVCLHGRPKFGDMPPTDPVRQAWEMAA